MIPSSKSLTYVHFLVRYGNIFNYTRDEIAMIIKLYPLDDGIDLEFAV